MSGSIGAYVAGVDALLAAGQSLFAAPTAPVPATRADRPLITAEPTSSGLGAGAMDVGTDYEKRWRAVAELDADTGRVGSDGRSENQRAGAAAAAVRATARAQADSIIPSAHAPAGARLLVSTMDERLAGMQREIETAKAQQRLLTTRLRQLASAYRLTGSAPPNPFTGSPLHFRTTLPRTVARATTPAGEPTAGAPRLTPNSTPRQVAARIIWEAHRRGYSRLQAIAILATAMQESALNPKARSANGLWESIFQQDASYRGRHDPNTAIAEFFDRLAGTGGPSSQDIWKSIFWLQQRPGDPSADAAYLNGRRAYLAEIRSQAGRATRLYDSLTV